MICFPHLDEKQYLKQLQEYIKNKRALILKDTDTAIVIMAFNEVTLISLGYIHSIGKEG